MQVREFDRDPRIEHQIRKGVYKHLALLGANRERERTDHVICKVRWIIALRLGQIQQLSTKQIIHPCMFNTQMPPLREYMSLGYPLNVMAVISSVAMTTLRSENG